MSLRQYMFPQGPHYMVNEDGVRFYHQGYELRQCMSCGILYIVGRISRATKCGRCC